MIGASAIVFRLFVTSSSRMTIETTGRNSNEAERTHDQARGEKIRIIQRATSWALAMGFVGVLAILGGTVWGSYVTSIREARVFASVSATAFGQGFCDRALRLAVAGLPPDEGAFPASFHSRQLQGQLSFFATALNVLFD